MPGPGLIERRGLLNWADSIAARSELPRLIRRLILETAVGVVQLGFPAGEGVAAGSWDGTVRATEAGPFVPVGLSLWELSVEESVTRKADEDYAKRNATTDGSPTGECTYVAALLRPFTKRADWAREKTNDGTWKEVRALGVDDLETWLETAPVTHAWLSELTGLHPYGLVTAATWWQTWSSATNPGFPVAALLAGRDPAAHDLRKAVSSPGQITTISGSSPDEVVAFVASVAVEEQNSDGGALLARTAFIDQVQTWRRLRDHEHPLVLVALTEDVAVEFLPGTGHALIIPTTAGSDADIELVPVDAQLAAEVLKRDGLEATAADEVGKLARLSLLAARRRIALKRELHRPTWAKPPAAKIVRRLALLGRWDAKLDADRALVARVVGLAYDDLREEAAALAAGGDPLLARLGSTFQVVSPFDAWLLLRGDMEQDDLEAFFDSAREVLLELDPRLELARDDTWRASLLGKNRAFSHNLRRGIATTLALLGGYGERQLHGADSTGRDWATRIVREALDAANSHGSVKLWASLADVLPLLAEAAPDVFLEAVRAGTSGEPPFLSDIFEDSSGSRVSMSSPHTNLLWALETCSWSPNHFGQVVFLLARLAEIDLGGKLMNRPLGSLRMMMARCLEELVERGARDEEVRFLSQYHLKELFALLARSELPADRLARLEWAYLPAFRMDDPPQTLSRMLMDEPTFFVDIVRRVYRPQVSADVGEDSATPREGKAAEVDEERASALTANAYRLLSATRWLPGQREDGSVDADELARWVGEVRAALKETGHLEVGDSHIGRMLAWGPADDDGARPGPVVRDLLEQLQSQEIERGLGIELYNSRGVTTRSPIEGGEQERELAAVIREQVVAFADRWPRTAAVLRGLAESYARDSRWHEADAERHRTGFD